MNSVTSKKEDWELGELTKGHLVFTVVTVLGTGRRGPKALSNHVLRLCWGCLDLSSAALHCDPCRVVMPIL